MARNSALSLALTAAFSNSARCCAGRARPQMAQRPAAHSTHSAPPTRAAQPLPPAHPVRHLRALFLQPLRLLRQPRRCSLLRGRLLQRGRGPAPHGRHRGHARRDGLCARARRGLRRIHLPGLRLLSAACPAAAASASAPPPGPAGGQWAAAPPRWPAAAARCAVRCCCGCCHDRPARCSPTVHSRPLCNVQCTSAHELSPVPWRLARHDCMPHARLDPRAPLACTHAAAAGPPRQCPAAAPAIAVTLHISTSWHGAQGHDSSIQTDQIASSCLLA